MPDDFDPYREWLGLHPAAGPVTHYRLLGLADFETDLGKIAAAADERMSFVRAQQVGPRGRLTHKVLNDLAAAKLCLLDARAKPAYDAGLRAATAAIKAMPVALPLAGRGAALPPSPPTPAPPLIEPPAVAPPVTSARPEPVVVAPPRSEAHEPAPSDAESPPSQRLVAVLLVLFVVTACASWGVYAVWQRRLAKKGAEAPANVEKKSTDGQAGPKEDQPSRPPAAEVVIQQEGNGDLHFPVTAARFEKPVALAAAADDAALLGLENEGAVAAWRFNAIRPAVVKVEMIYQAQHAAGARWELELSDSARARDIITSGNLEDVQTDVFVWKIPRSGEQTLALKTRGAGAATKLKLRSLRFIYQTR